MLLRLCLAFILALGMMPGVASAQQSSVRTVTDIIDFLMTNRAVDTGDFDRDQAAAEIARDTITRALLVNLTAVPLGTSSSGFLYRLSPELGTVERATESFGGFFIERALTPGRGRASFGVSATTSSFDRLDGQVLREGTLVTTANRFRNESAPFDTEFLTLKVRSSALTFFASVGITDRLEVGGALPLVRLTVEGQRVEVYYGETGVQALGSAVASGMADAAVRAKYALVAARSGGVAIAGEVRLPTGDERNLLGAGSPTLRVMGIGSFERDRMSLHGNASVVRGGVSDELNFGGAAALALAPQLTLTGELSARYLQDLRSVVLTAAPHPSKEDVDTLRLTGGELGRTITSGIAGLKWNPTGTFVLGAHVRWSLTSAGLTSPLTPSIGLEYAF